MANTTDQPTPTRPAQLTEDQILDVKLALQFYARNWREVASRRPRRPGRHGRRVRPAPVHRRHQHRRRRADRPDPRGVPHRRHRRPSRPSEEAPMDTVRVDLDQHQQRPRPGSASTP